MRKLLELVMIMVFCVSVASGTNIILISDSGLWRGSAEVFKDATGAAKYNDTAMVIYLESLGYTVDTSGMGGHYRDIPITGDTHWTVDPAKIAALNAADLIIVSRYAASGSYDGDRLAWNQLTKPILSQNGQLCRSGTAPYQYWGWCNGGNGTTNLLVMPVLMGHELVDGFGNPITLFSATPPKVVTNPALAATWDARTSIIGTLNNLPMLVDIPAGTNFDTLCGTTNFYGIAGARRVYLGHWGYDATATPNYTWDQSLTAAYKALFAQAVAAAMSPVRVLNNSPANNALPIPVDPAASENDLVFTILDSNVTAVDVYLGTQNEPNLTSNPQYQIVNDLAVTQGQNTIDLVGELTQNLSAETNYYWRVVALEPNTTTSVLEPVGKGPVWKFTTEAARPVIYGVSPAKIVAAIGEPNAVFTVTGQNIETWRWYKDADSIVGGGTALSNGADYSGVDTDTLVINNIDAGDFMYYYCVGSRTGFTPVTSTSSGKLEMKGLVHHFPFDSATGGKTLDSIGGVQAELMGGASLGSADSIVGNYLQLDNAGATDTQYAQILDSSVADYQEITISAWVRQDTRDIGCVFDFGADSNNYFTFTPGYKEGVAKTEFTYQMAGVKKQGENEVNYNRTGGWQFVTVTLDSVGQSKTYIDGQFKGSGDLRGDDVLEINLTDITKTYNYIGNRIYSTTLPKFDGLIDELKIYNYVRTTEEIAQDYMDVRTDVTYVCNSEEDDLSAVDFDGNCRIDLADLAEFLSKWLEHDRIYRP
jgi:hypothetical protein